jgi:hypothetical protein
MVDFDNDGLVDLYSTNVTAPDAMFRQDPANPGTFIDVTAAWGILHDNRAECGAVAADFDNDGDFDLFVPCGGNPGLQKDRMWRNDLNVTGTFTDVIAAGLGGDLATTNTSSFGALAFDADLDADLDIFLGNNRYTDQATGQQVYPTNTLLLNLGGFVFQDVTLAAGMTQVGDFRHCGAADLDNDGDVDVGVSDFEGDSLIYLNDGAGFFTDRHVQLGIVAFDNNFGVVFEDMDGDGWLDVIIPRFRHWTKIFLNNADGTFRDVTTSSGIKRHDIMGHTVHDMDMDGYPDLLFGTGHAASVQLDIMYLSSPWGTGIKLFDVSTSSRVNSPGLTRCHGQPVGDVNDDLWPDVFFCNGGPPSYPNSNGDKSLFISRGDNSNHRLQVGVTGVENNLYGIGAKVTAVLPGGRMVSRVIQAGKGFGNTDEPDVFLGLGADTSVDYLEILWPGKVLQRVLVPSVDASYDVTETGIEMNGSPAVGGPMDMHAYGPANFDVDLLWSTTTSFGVNAGLGGVFELGPNYGSLSTFSLDAAGRFDGVVTLPNDPLIAGTTIYLQAHLMNSAGTVHALSNKVDIAIP